MGKKAFRPGQIINKLRCLQRPEQKSILCALTPDSKHSWSKSKPF